MYIRKSFLKAIVIAAAICILAALAVLFCFTEVQVSPTIFYTVSIIALLLISAQVNTTCRR